MDVHTALQGITPPLVTPFENGSIDESALGALIEHVEDGGVDALFPCGTTGEFPALTPAERLDVIERTVEHADVPVVAGAAATSVDETIDAVENAASIGADAAAIVAPYFTTANDPMGNRQFFEAVLDAVSIPTLLYNIPQCTGQRIEPETVEAVAAHERAIGIKDSSGDLAYFLSVMERTPEDFRCLQGYDAILVPSLRMGADGGINALSNVIPATFREVVDDPGSDRARELQAEAIAPLFETCTTHDFAPATKTALVERGVLSSDDVRPPLIPVEDTASIGRALDRALAVTDR